MFSIICKNSIGTLHLVSLCFLYTLMLLLFTDEPKKPWCSVNKWIASYNCESFQYWRKAEHSIFKLWTVRSVNLVRQTVGRPKFEYIRYTSHYLVTSFKIYSTWKIRSQSKHQELYHENRWRDCNVTFWKHLFHTIASDFVLVATSQLKAFESSFTETVEDNVIKNFTALKSKHWDYTVFQEWILN